MRSQEGASEHEAALAAVRGALDAALTALPLVNGATCGELPGSGGRQPDVAALRAVLRRGMNELQVRCLLPVEIAFTFSNGILCRTSPR